MRSGYAAAVMQAFVLFWCLPLATASVQPGTHKVELRITDHKAGIADFSELLVSLASVSLHKAGAGRSEGWFYLYGKTAFIDIVPLKDGKYTTVATVEVPALQYDAVKIRFSELKSELLSGEEPVVSFRDSTVVTGIPLHRYPQLALVIDLYAEDQTEHVSGGYVVKVKEVRIEH